MLGIKVFYLLASSFYVILTDSGQLLACGSNAFGQLGVGQAASCTADLQAVEVSTC